VIIKDLEFSEFLSKLKGQLKIISVSNMGIYVISDTHTLFGDAAVLYFWWLKWYFTQSFLR
jgi:hypothetical protein